MLLAPSFAIAVEAKYTEPAYENIKTWLGSPEDSNRGDVLTGWHDMIHSATGIRLAVDQVLALPYQLVHRTASACFQPAPRRAVIYQVFDATHRKRYEADLRALRALLVTPALTLGVLVTTFTPSTVYTDLLKRWDAGKRTMAADVRAALLKGDLLAFGEPALSLL